MEQLIDSSMPELRLLGLVATALVLGAAVGFEREEAHKPAGLRTHMLVAAAAALLVGIGELLTQEFREDLSGRVIRADPLRVLEAMIMGVSFLGAGTIIRRRGEVSGLTTAASLLLTAGIGACVGLGKLVLAAGVVGLALVTLTLVGKLSDRLTE